MGCSVEQHVVGDDRGWDPASDFKGWASRKIFHVGDSLWFAYASSQQSVLELKSREEFENCDVSNPIKLYDGGLDVVPLIEMVSDGLDNVAKDLGLDLLSDGMEHYIAASASDDSMEEGAIKEVIVEGPTSSRRQLSDCPPSILINLTLSICGTIITMLIYAML
ncbi:early nodulin-like protein 19 [Cryptomeria japonica]|uniref:early nodulin-like protein 19 n=1 Tax=Cryptomeria japonica TaxID=3369 RepID=UPI0025ACC5DD|nr:early nodulin-like protein 19 [Cryptomeria japonica]